MKKLKFYLSIISFLTVGSSYVQAQLELDVLPTTDRNELFNSYLISELDKTIQARQTAYTAALASPTDLQAYQAQLRADYLNILGELPEKTPLNAQTVSVINQTGYNIELVAYESRPNHHVVANLYTPGGDGQQYPGVVVPCGHYGISNIKAWEYYQKLGMLLAENGFVALIIDPVASGERAQIVDPADGNLEFERNSGTATHSRLAVGSYLAGTSVPAYEAWDNVRGIDYLESRADVLTGEIGVVGSSGGGAQTMFLIGYDERIKVAGIVSALTTVTSMWTNGGPQDGCQNLAHMGEFHIDQQDFMGMIAPTPSMVLQGSGDGLFLSSGAEAGYLDAKRAYDELNESAKIAYFESEDGHGFTQPKREEAVQWLRTWFYNDSSEITEPAIYDDQQLTYEELMVTSTGQVMTEFADEKNITTLNLELVDSYESVRNDFWVNSTAEVKTAKVKELIKLDENYETPVVSDEGSITREGYTISKMKITSGDNVPLPALYFKADDASGKMPAVLYVDGLGKRVDAAEGGLIEKFYADSGYVVLAVDLRGFGETKDRASKNETKHNNAEHRNAVITEYIGKSLIGQRVQDIMISMDVLLQQENVDPNNVTIIGVDRAVTAVLHAAAVDNRYSDVKLWDFPYRSYREIVAAPMDEDNMTHVVVGALQHYDLTDLVSHIGESKVEYTTKPIVPEEPVEVLSTDPNENKFGIKVYPNPTERSATISYSLKNRSAVTLNIYNMSGQIIHKMINEEQEAGNYTIKTPNSLDTGVYFIKLHVNGNQLLTHKLIKTQ